MKRIMFPVVLFVSLLVFYESVVAQKFYDGPLNQTRVGSCADGSIEVTVETRVSRDKDTKDYFYWYKISNTGKGTVLVRWENIDRILTLSWATPNIFTIEPERSEEFTMVTKEPPLNFNGELSFYKYSELLGEDFKKLVKEKAGIIVETTSKNVLRNHLRCSQPGPLPLLLLRGKS